MAYKLDRVNVSIQKYISDIIQFDIKNHDIGFVTVTGCETTNDYSYTRVFVSFLDDKNVHARLEALENVKGVIRSKLAKKLTIRKCPELIFVLDDSFQKGQEIEAILAKIKQEK